VLWEQDEGSSPSYHTKKFLKNKKLNRMIIQKNLKGEIINKYTTKTEAARVLGLDESSIRKAIKFDRTVLGKFKFIYQEPSEISYVSPNVKILIVDIETAPIKGYVWGLWQQNMYLDQIISDWFMLSWSAKWLGSDEVMSEVLLPSEAIKENDYNIVQPLWELLNEADIVIAHNGDRFDIPKMNSRFIFHGMMPPSSYKQIDTKKVAKNIFGESSNKLEALARKFGYEGKFDTDFQLWKDCLEGSSEALLRMSIYNDQDVRVLEKVYLKLRPYIKGHPNLDLYIDSEKATCPHCGSHNIKILEGKFFYTQAAKYQLYRCEDCKTVFRSKKAVEFKHKKTVSAIPR
jgi:DNA-directed RNA polymerase subunit RPC12/RpoP